VFSFIRKSRQRFFFPFSSVYTFAEIHFYVRFHDAVLPLNSMSNGSCHFGLVMPLIVIIGYALSHEVPPPPLTTLVGPSMNYYFDTVMGLI